MDIGQNEFVLTQVTNNHSVLTNFYSLGSVCICTLCSIMERGIHLHSVKAGVVMLIRHPQPAEKSYL